jgi:hypothetical protein
MAPKCLATKADNTRCDSDAKFPTDNRPLVCGNHRYKLKADGTFDKDATKAPATPPKAKLEIKRAAEEDGDMQQMLATVVGEQADLLAFKTIEHKNKVSIEITYKKHTDAPSPAILQQMKEKDDKIAELEAQLAAAGIAQQ